MKGETLPKNGGELGAGAESAVEPISILRAYSIPGNRYSRLDTDTDQ